MSRSKILIVDDDVPVAGLLIELLIGEGFEAAHASSGAAALVHLAWRCFVSFR